MIKKVLLDTSFLITLSDESRENHKLAKEFYKYFLDEKISMIISSIVVSEFSIKEPISDLPLQNFQFLPFNINDAIKSAEIYDIHYQDRALQRDCLKDDFKILAQCINSKASYFITDDEELIDKIIVPNKSKWSHNITALKISSGVFSYFGGKQLSIEDNENE
ncbi:MAG: PIN domain-containing protein [Saprospiraceae bacterium]|nr:PIN domain-containing protein [Saprospiraceae bacterium]